METYLALLAIPLIWPLIAKAFWRTTITWQEMLANAGIVVLLISIVYAFGLYSNIHDKEIINGEVTGKEKNMVSCSHSYPCNCRSVSCGEGCSTVECDTCYSHPHDWDWDVYSNVGVFSIERLDSQGSQEPPRWTIVQKGQPVALTHNFINYIKAVPESLFHDKLGLSKKFAALIPPYPGKVYDYHYVDRVIPVSVAVPDLKLWNQELALSLRDLGPKKQANVIIVFVNTADESYIHALEAAWLGGKKNDIIIVIGTTAYPKIDWVQVISWTKAELFKVQLRDDIFNLKNIDRVSLISTIHKHTEMTYVRRQMKDFEYLKHEIEPPMGVLIFAFILGIIGSVGLSVLFHKNEFKVNHYRR